MPKFSKRHYIMIADVLNDLFNADDRSLFTLPEVGRACEAFARAFERDNPRFSADRFREAVFRVHSARIMDRK